MNKLVYICAALLSGFLLAFGFPGFHFPYYSWGFIIPLALLPLFVSIELLPYKYKASGRKLLTASPGKRFRSAFFLCWITGVVTTAFGFFWTTKPAILFGKLPPTMAYCVFAIYCLLAGFFLAFVFLPFSIDASVRVKRAKKGINIFVLAIAATFLEQKLPRFFHWTIGSLMHSEAPVNQWSSIGGYSIGTFFAVFTSGYLARILTHQTVTMPRVLLKTSMLAFMWIGIYTFGYIRLAELDYTDTRKTRIGFIQPNFTFDELSSNPEPSVDGSAMSMEKLLTMSQSLVDEAQENKLDLIIWPESVTPFEFANSETLLNQVKEFAARIQVPILVQATEYDEKDLEEKGYRGATMFSASFLIRPDGSKSKSFRKWVPIPFGEAVPMEQYFPSVAEFLRSRIGNLSKVGVGTSFEALAYSPEFAVAPLICFDSIYPELPRLQAYKGNASFFVNQANFVWMGRSNAGYEFRELDRFRAIENARSMLLVANTGPSIAFDPAGRPLTEQTELLHSASKIVELPVSTETTFYSRWGDLPLTILGSIMVVFVFIEDRRKRR